MLSGLLLAMCQQGKGAGYGSLRAMWDHAVLPATWQR